MSGRFFYDAARYNPYTDVITFFLVDGETLVMCSVTREALEWLECKVGLSSSQLEAAFRRHRNRIEIVVTGRHRAGSKAVCVLVKNDFAEERA